MTIYFIDAEGDLIEVCQEKEGGNKRNARRAYNGAWFGSWSVAKFVAIAARA